MDNKTDDEVLDKWVNNINEIVDLVDFVTERIEREEITAWFKLFNLIIMTRLILEILFLFIGLNSIYVKENL